MGGDLNEYTKSLELGPNYNLSNHTVLYLVCPQTISELQELYIERKSFYEKLRQIEVFWPHFSGEQFRADLSLRLYKYST
jgi:hypothetical protein